MENKSTDNSGTRYQLWLSHALVAVITIVILVVLQVIQPWSDSAMTIVHSFRVSLASVMSDGVEDSEAIQEIVFTAPSHFYFSGSMAGIEQKIIVVGRDVYINERQLKDYVTYEAIALGVAGLIPGMEHTESVLSDFADIEELENQKIGGIICHHYRGSVDLTKDIREQIELLDPEQPNYDAMVAMLKAQIEAMQEIVTNFEAWIGKEDGLVRQLIYEAHIDSEALGKIEQSQVIKYSDINVPIEIKAPLDSSGELLPGWYKASSS